MKKNYNKSENNRPSISFPKLCLYKLVKIRSTRDNKCHHLNYLYPSQSYKFKFKSKPPKIQLSNLNGLKNPAFSFSARSALSKPKNSWRGIADIFFVRTAWEATSYVMPFKTLENIASGNYIIDCPEYDCDEKMSEKEGALVLNQEQFSRFVRFKHKVTLENDPNNKFCNRPDCGELLVEMKDKKLFCKTCNMIFCLMCQEPLHPNK